MGIAASTECSNTHVHSYCLSIDISQKYPVIYEQKKSVPEFRMH